MPSEVSSADQRPAPAHLRAVTFASEAYPTREHYPFDRPVIQQLHEMEFRSSITFFIGENGTGKSTVLEALARAAGIHIWGASERGRFKWNPYEGLLHRYMTLHWVNGLVPGSFFGADLFRNFAESLDEWAAADPGLLKYFGGASLVTQSHGQSLMSFFCARYTLRGLYLLDEPETALSPKTQVELLRLLAQYSQQGCAQFIIATHSPILLACPGAAILSFDALPVRPMLYENTEHYQVYKAFLNDPDSFIFA
ncbi:MAG TPA: AAA family ATPase [Candidatus Hydrogenedentes bacterium]|nr:AAA family ATPase [Candidatus Hydrogenedentota bacterium]